MQSVDLDQTPHSVVSDLGLHCLLMSLLWEARFKRVKKKKGMSQVKQFVKNRLICQQWRLIYQICQFPFTHLCRVDSSTSVLWSASFPI